MAFLLALDQGTTSSRAIIFTDSGEMVAVAQQEFKQYFPQPGWVEHDPQEIWTSQLSVAQEALTTAKLQPADIAAIGITNQRETVVLWDRETGKPIHNAIVWQDRRTAAVCEQLRSAGYEPTIQQKTGLLLDPYFSGTKVAWLLDHVEGARQAAEAGKLACGTIDSWLIYNLTAGQLHITDASNASRTMMMNIHSGEWDEQLLGILQVPPSVLPTIKPSSEIYGEVASSLPLAGIPIGGIAGDQQSALFGQACYEAGKTKNTYGTGCFMLMNTGEKAVASTNKLLTTVAWQLGETTEYALEGSVFIGGAVIGWLRDGLGLIKNSSDVEALASTVSDTDGLVMVPAFTGLGAPHWDPYARGTILGITRGTTSAHFARAALESIAFQVTDLIQAMHADSDKSLPELRVDGGATANNLLLQFQADILQIPVVRPQVTETTALGAAYLAGLAAGVWADRNAIAGQWQVDQEFHPQISADEAVSQHARWQRAVKRSFDWARED